MPGKIFTTAASSSRPWPRRSRHQEHLVPRGREGQRELVALAGFQHDTEIFDEDVHCRAWRVIAIEDVRHAVLEHPGRAGAVRDHFVEHAGIGTGLDAQSHRLCGGRDMHARQQLLIIFTFEPVPAASPRR